MQAIVTSQRTGSTYLCYLLNASQGLSFDLTEDPELDKFIWGEHLRYGLEYYDRLMPIRTKLHWNFIENFKIQCPEKPVFLYRKNKLAQAVSLYRSNASNKPHYNLDEKIIDTPFSVNDAACCLSEILAWDWNFRQFLLNKSHLSVSYEDLLENPIEIVNSILEYWNLSLLNNFSLEKIPLQKIAGNEENIKCLEKWLLSGQDLADRQRKMFL